MSGGFNIVSRGQVSKFTHYLSCFNHLATKNTDILHLLFDIHLRHFRNYVGHCFTSFLLTSLIMKNLCGPDHLII